MQTKLFFSRLQGHNRGFSKFQRKSQNIINLARRIYICIFIFQKKREGNTVCVHFTCVETQSFTKHNQKPTSRFIEKNSALYYKLTNTTYKHK